MATRLTLQARAVAAASLANYDGSAGVLVDTNLWIDCIDASSPWHERAMEQLQTCSERSPLHVNLMVSSWFRHDPANGRSIDAQPHAKAIGAAVRLDGRAGRPPARASPGPDG